MHRHPLQKNVSIRPTRRQDQPENADREEPRVISDANGMIKTLMTAFVVFLGAVLALPAVAQDSAKTDENTFYVSYSGGVAYFRNQRLTGADATGANLSGQVESKVGFNVGGAFGKRFHEHFRGEIELGYHRSEVDDLSAQGEDGSAQGFFSMLSVMANGYVDYDLDIGVIPYVGAGIGWGRVELDAKNENGILRMEGEDNVFTWSLMIGGTVPVNDIMDISLGYRYIATVDTELNGGVVQPGGTTAERFDSEFDSHEGVLALRYKF